LQAAFAAGAAGLRLVLATPALFAKGWLPGWLDDRLEGTPPHGSGLKLKLRGVALDRWGALSGWDMRPDKPHPSHQGGAARSTRRLVPAGAVYWFEILANTGAANIAERLWLASVCDAENDRRDGFGLALPGVWQAAPSNHHA
jgi:CRISPR-associated protein Cmr3